tara:strand:+ start:3306 stop:3698 length:393 start_codon:yes stop_codon:yes gene_type:complete
MARIIGNEGNASIAGHDFVVNAWSMSVSRVVSDVTGYADTATNVRGGLASFSGSASGFLKYGAGSTDPNLDVAEFAAGSVEAVVLTAATGCTYNANAVISGVSIGVSKTGDTTISFDFTFATAPVETWTS